MNWSPVKRMALVAALVLLFDRLTKMAVVRYIAFGDQHIIVPGFFKFVHWGNTGAAWSMFYGNNGLLAVVSLLALAALFLSHHHFDSHRPSGQLALGLTGPAERSFQQARQLNPQCDAARRGLGQVAATGMGPRLRGLWRRLFRS